MTTAVRRRVGGGLLSAALVGGLLVTAPAASAAITSAGPSPVNTGRATITFTTDSPVAPGAEIVFDGPAPDDTFTSRVDDLQNGDPRRPQTTVDFSAPAYRTAPGGPANPGSYAVTIAGLTSPESCTSCFTVLAPSLPTVASVAPSGVSRGTAQQVVLTGTGFSRDTRVVVLDADGSVPASDAVAQVVARRPGATDAPNGTGAATPGSLRRVFEVRQGVPLGVRTLRLVATDGRSRDCVGCFSVFGPPLTSFSPDASTNTPDDGAVQVRFTAPAGTFGPDATATLVHVGSSRGSATAAALSVPGRRTGLTTGSGSTDDVLTAVFDLRGAAPGQDAYQPTVTSSSGGSNAGRTRFDITQPSPPTVSGAAPTARAAGTSERINVSGTGFARGAVLTLTGGTSVQPFPVVTGTDVQVTSTTLSALVTIPADAPAGPRDVVVTNTDGASGTRDDALTVTAAATPAASGSGTPSASASASGTPTPAATPTGSASASPTPSATATASTTPTGTPTANPLPAPTRPRLVLPRSTITSQESARVLGTADPGSVVELYAYSRPRTTYVRVRRAVVGESGQVEFEVGPSGNTRMYLRRTDVGGARRLDSASVVLMVRTGIDLEVTRIGTKTYRFTGSTLPKRRGQTVNVRYRSGGRTVVASTARVASDGTYAVVRRFTGSGTFDLFTDTGADIDNAAGTSRPVRTTLR